MLRSARDQRSSGGGDRSRAHRDVIQPHSFGSPVTKFSSNRSLIPARGSRRPAAHLGFACAVPLEPIPQIRAWAGKMRTIPLFMPDYPARPHATCHGFVRGAAKRITKNTQVRKITVAIGSVRQWNQLGNALDIISLPVLSLWPGVVCGIVVGPRATTAISFKGKGVRDVA